MDYFADCQSDAYAMADAPMYASYNEHAIATDASAPPMFEDEGEVDDYMAPSAPSFEPLSANQHQEYYQHDYEYSQEMINKLIINGFESRPHAAS